MRWPAGQRPLRASRSALQRLQYPRTTCPLLDSPPPAEAHVSPEISFRRLDRELPPPRPAHAGDAAFDLSARSGGVLEPGERATIPTGIAVAIPPGHGGLVVPRSGLAAKHGLSVVNGPGLIDSGYRGEVNVILVNLGSKPFEYERGDRIAQLMVVPVVAPVLIEVDELGDTERGEGGLGSTGM